MVYLISPFIFFLF